MGPGPEVDAQSFFVSLIARDLFPVTHQTQTFYRCLEKDFLNHDCSFVPILESSFVSCTNKHWHFTAKGTLSQVALVSDSETL